MSIVFGTKDYSRVLIVSYSIGFDLIVRNYTEKDLLDDNEVKERFAKDLIDGYKSSIK